MVDEVEKSFGIDIKVASVGALGQTLTTAFNTKDPFGNPSIDLATGQVYLRFDQRPVCHYLQRSER
ncbi:MAG: hypothetical protein ACLVFC_06985 [Subdoligranulum sp.]